MRVIFINTFTSYNVQHKMYEPGTDEFFSFGMGKFIADEFAKRTYPIIFENWRTDYRISDYMEKTIDGMKCRIFPSKKIKFFGEYSSIFNRVLIETAKENNVVFHFMGVHRIDFYFWAFLVRKSRVVSTHLGGANPLWKFQQSYFKFQSALFYLAERFFLMKSYNHFISIAKKEVDYYKKLSLSSSFMPIFGLSRINIFYIKDRQECRKKLGLPLDKKIILQVGRATANRGFDWYLDMLSDMDKSDQYHFEFIGIDPSNEYYDRLVALGYNPKPYSDQNTLVDYYNAADILIFLLPEPIDINFGGTGYVPLEALACGTPVIATTFDSFPSEEVYKVSRIPKCKEDVYPMIEELLDANIDRQFCRDIVLETFSWDTVIQKHWEIYNNESKAI